MESGIHAVESTRLGRHVQVGVAGQRVISVSFPAQAEASGDHPVLERIVAYLEGDAESFEDVTVGLTVPADRRAVLETAREIPYGESVTLETLVAMTPGLDEEDTETARAALAENPVPLVVPDHRVENTPGGAPTEVAAEFRSIEAL